MSYKSLNEIDVVFISYDEDNCEENWTNLQSMIPWAQRVHGVKGSDAAHKAAANLSTTDRFISIDADNIIDLSFFSQEIDFDHPKLQGKAVSWSARNVINGLEYGNGGLKCWPKEYVLNMRTHENADPTDERNQVDFCWEDSYVQMANCFSTTHPNGSPRQAFRAGFREGVKMCLLEGGKTEPENLIKKMWWGNYKRLITWCSVGADVQNGLWAIYGARLGCYLTTLSDWDFKNVRDFEYLNALYNEQEDKFSSGNKTDVLDRCYKTGVTWNKTRLEESIKELGISLRKGCGIEIAELDETQSKFYKAAYVNVPRMNKLLTENELNELRRINK